MSVIGFNSNTNKIIKNAIGGLIFQFLIRFKGVFILPLIVNFYNQNEIADWRIITTIVSLAIPVFTLNILDGSAVFFSNDFNNKSVSEKFNTIFHITHIVLFLFFVPLIFILKNNELTNNITVFIVANVYVNFLLKLAILLPQVYQKTKKLILISFITEYGSSFITVLLLFTNHIHFYSLIIPILLTNFIVSVWLLLIVFKEIKYHPFYINKKFIKETLAVCLPLIPVFFTEWIISSISIFLIGFYHSKEMIGSFSVALSIASLILTLKSTLQYFWFSTCSHLLLSKNILKFNSLYILIYKTYSFVIIIGIFFYLFFVDDLIKLLSNISYLLLKKSIIILSLGYSFLILSTLLNGVLYALGKTKEIMWAYILSASFCITSSAILIPYFGLIGASISTLIGNITLFITMLAVTKKHYMLPVIKNETKFLIMIGVLFIIGTLIRFYLVDIFIVKIIGIIYIFIVFIIAYFLNFVPIEVNQFINKYLKKLWT